jgi:beta-galactosidase
MRYAVDWKYEPTNKQPGIGVSEYGAGASIKHHEENVKKPKTDGDWHPEEWQAVCHEGNYEEIVKREWLWGTFVWNMFDFASASRREGDTYGINDKGLVTYDRKVRKDAFYYYKAQWNKEPMVHICSKRFAERTQNTTAVKVYSNCSDVQLEVNGKALGSVSPKLNVYEWKGVALQKGENTIKVTANGGGEIITDTCVWTLK